MFELIDFLIVNPIVNILFVIYNFVGDFGVAIILFTILVKFLMWPLTKRQLHQTKLMRKIQPELTEIRKRCNGNKQLESLQMMDLYKKNNIKPFRSIWTILIQLPIFIALFNSINVMVNPRVTDYVEKRAYAPVASLERINDVIELQKPYLEYLNKKAECANNSDSEECQNLEAVSYGFEPKLFGMIDLSAKAGFASKSSFAIFCFAIAAAFIQYLTSKQQTASGKKGGFRDSWKKMVQDAKDGKDPDQAEMNNMVSSQMSFMMPLMMLMIMINLSGAIVFYYFLSYCITFVQQKIILNKVDDTLDDNTDRAILRELKQKTKRIQEAEVIKNKKTGTTIRTISASDAKNKNKKQDSANHSG